MHIYLLASWQVTLSHCQLVMRVIATCCKSQNNLLNIFYAFRAALLIRSLAFYCIFSLVVVIFVVVVLAAKFKALRVSCTFARRVLCVCRSWPDFCCFFDCQLALQSRFLCRILPHTKWVADVPHATTGSHVICVEICQINLYVCIWINLATCRFLFLVLFSWFENCQLFLNNFK